MIDMQNVTKSYATGVQALNGVTLHIDKGEFVFIVGNSGSGKSTLIKLLLKELDPSSGTIKVNGINLNKMKAQAIPKYRRKLGVVFQDFRLLKDRNVYENIAFAQRVIATPSKDIRKNVPKMLSLVGLAEKYKSFPKQLSGGEQQRVAIARALAKNPKLLLCDEPTGALDYKTGKAILHLLQEASTVHGRTVVLITHNTAFKPIAHRVIHIHEGRVASVELNDSPSSAEAIEW